jgi:EAL domain-containing protein (putative c-di-GMP-specific phosphodiesterase class I)
VLEPDGFVTVAEETGLILPLGDFVLAEACGQLARWRRAGIASPSLSMAVNVSIRQLERAGFVDRVTAAIAEARLDPGSLVLEVTESVLMDDVTIVGQLAELRALGVQLAIDDFGTGYSSLDRLRRLPVGTIKIDKSFVDELETAPAAAPLVAAMIAMAHRLELRVVAEGVETEGQLHALRELGCDAAQGYLFSRPVPARTLASKLRLSPGGILSTT